MRNGFRSVVGLVGNRPRLAAAIAVGLLVGVGLVWFAPRLSPTTRSIAGWDVFCLTFLGLVLRRALKAGTPKDIRAHADREDEGRGLILGLVLAATVAGLAATAVQLSEARDAKGWVRAAHVTTAIGTVALSWLVTQVVFALHYAHEYYTAAPNTGGDAEGLKFPGRGAPDVWDFLHFSVVIGAAAQTADVAFTSRGLRRLGTLHSLIAFAFNTLVLALTINLLAGLF